MSEDTIVSFSSIKQLRLGKIMELMVKTLTDTANGMCVGLNDLGLEALQPKVLQMNLVIVLEC